MGLYLPLGKAFIGWCGGIDLSRTAGKCWKLSPGVTLKLFDFVCIFYPVVGGASFADIGQALDEILSFSMDVSDEETKEPFPVQSHKDIVISCCWLHIKVRSWDSFTFDSCTLYWKEPSACKSFVI